ncbi:T9SS type A sorting domain-containing protein [candidate division WOR-3 bacterium]|nr:T9SS type A sorting domain-containing protein [candidate division WOR-3 bacterium]MCK4330268.1 T9SS type A sorting domain-containing protein [candidate division WOR-3 bacterium]
MKTVVGLLLLCGVCGASPKTAFVVNGLGETLSLIDLEDGTVENNVVTLGLAPNWVCVNDGMVYVVNSISDDIYFIDIQTNLVADSILLPEGSNPYAMEFLNDSIAYVSAFCANSVFCMNVKRKEILETIPVGLSPEGLCITQDEVFVAITAYDPNTYTWGEGMVYVIDAPSNSVIDSVSVGVNPQHLEVDPDGELYVVCTGNYGAVTGVVYRTDGVTHQVLDSLMTGGTPLSISISSNGIAWIGAGGWTDNGYVYMIDTETESIIHGSSNPILVGRGVLGVTCDGNGNCYTCNFGTDDVSVIDETGSIIRTFGVGDGPQAIAIYEPTYGIEDLERRPDIILSVYPNPFRESIVISYQSSVIGNQSHHYPITDHLSPITLKIYDLTGRLVKQFTIYESRFTNHEIAWDGRDKQDKRVENGVYFVKLHGLTEKVILLR